MILYDDLKNMGGMMLEILKNISELKKVLLSENLRYRVTFSRKAAQNNDYSGNVKVTLPKNDVTSVLLRKARQTAEGNVVTLKNNNVKIRKEDWLMMFEERAAIFEYIAGVKRREAEIKAFDECILRLMDLDKKHTLNTAVSYLLSCGLHNPD